VSRAPQIKGGLQLAIEDAEMRAADVDNPFEQEHWLLIAGWLRELRARRLAMGREPGDEVNAPADLAALVAVVDPDTGTVVQILDTGDSCHAYETGDLCGGCGRCLLEQAEHAGWTIERIWPAEHYSPPSAGDGEPPWPDLPGENGKVAP